MSERDPALLGHLHSLLSETLRDDSLLRDLADAAIADAAGQGPDDARSAAERVLGRFESRRGTGFSAEQREALIRELLDPDAGHHLRFFGSHDETSLLEALKGEALILASGRHLVETRTRALRLFRRFFPAFYRDVRPKMRFALDAEVGGEFNSVFREIVMRAPEAFIHRNEHAEVRSVFDGDRPVSVRVAALLLFFHEYAHAVFEQGVPYSEPYGMRGVEYPDTAYSAMTEGFAVMLELLLVDKMLAARQELGLTGRDAAYLSHWKRQRLASLKRKRTGPHTEGTLRFWHKVYKQGGERGMLRFLESLDPETLSSLSVRDALFKGARGRPELFMPLLSGENSPPRSAERRPRPGR